MEDLSSEFGSWKQRDNAHDLTRPNILVLAWKEEIVMEFFSTKVSRLLIPYSMSSMTHIFTRSSILLLSSALTKSPAPILGFTYQLRSIGWWWSWEFISKGNTCFWAYNHIFGVVGKGKRAMILKARSSGR